MTTVDAGVAAAGDQSSRRSANLTREEAATRAQAIQVKSYQIEIDLTDVNGDPTTDAFHSTTTVTFTAQPHAQTFIDLVPGPSGALHSASLNGAALDVKDYDADRGLPLTDLTTDNTLKVEAHCTYSHDGEGLYRFEDLTDKEIYLYTQFETAAAKRMFACFDQPDLKASFELTVIAPAPWVVVANTMAHIEAAGNAKRHTFAPTAPINSYVVALIAGPYASWPDTYKAGAIEIPLRIFCRKSLREAMDRDAGQLFDLTKAGFGFYHNIFDVPYPFGKYDQIFCPNYNAGAMENVAAVTFTDDLVFPGQVTRSQKARRAETLLHEMAHMWFGDLVTMKWWDDLWLNESFATWASNLCLTEATEFVEAWTTFANTQKPTGYRQDQLPTTHPVADDVPSLDLVDANFDPITYIKGASTLKQLFKYIGRDHFLAGLHDYFTAHAYRNAQFQDLLDALQHHAPNRDLGVWAKQWLKTTGLTTLRADFAVNSGKFTRFAVTQSNSAPGNAAPRPQRLSIGIYDDDHSGALTRVRQVELDVAGARTEVEGLHGVSRGKLIIVNDDDETYCSLRFDTGSFQTALTRVAEIADPLARAQVWSTIWEMTRNGEFRPRDFAALVESLVYSETQVAVTANLLSQVQTALTSYTDPAWASEHGWPAFADRLLELARDADAGSDAQLAYINALGADRAKERQRSSVLSERHTQVLSALLDFDDPKELGLAGLRVDTEQRWRIVIALATAGVPDADRLIHTQYQKDRSETGRLNAAQARAARPLAESKKALWHQLMEDKDISNSDARALAAGFAAPGQAELLAPYTARYFDSIAAVWNNRPEAVATTLVNGLYPVWDISQDGIDAANVFLAGPDVPPPLIRKIREQQADVIRAVAARAVDAQP
ncbi:MAG: aminopeptidase N [Mycobacterium sp.]|uniref:aminopeptidase N n=1 Tax=Mycobacterium sp. TaxID=1785 RepID=UPI003C876E47